MKGSVDNKSTLVQKMAWCQKAKAIISTYDVLVYLAVYASLGPDELHVSSLLANGRFLIG